MLSKIPTWRPLWWAPRAMRCTLLSEHGNPLIEMAPQSAEGRSTFGDNVTLMHAAPKMLAALRLAEEAWGSAADNDEPINGGDMVDWFTNHFLPAARTAIAEASGAKPPPASAQTEGS